MITFQNMSLDSFRFNVNFALDWDKRFNILKGVAAGLLYLHEEWEQVVIHRDVKSRGECDSETFVYKLMENI